MSEDALRMQAGCIAALLDIDGAIVKRNGDDTTEPTSRRSASGGGLTFGSSEAQGLGRSGSIRGLGLLGEPREAIINPGTLLDDGLEWLQK